ncbi:phosphoribosylformylglycinamidine synthase I [Candidatus Magnetoovum chiemensis]|nr:phosphoribosylformylglycinamidine synthase I [Candidatus Magnetoovum chiemensis]
MVGIIVFPGSNCDYDCYYAIEDVLDSNAKFIWHKEDKIDKDIKLIILPGGFSYGDYLRAGAIARFSPILGALKDFADNGGFVLGICNGFQILLEAGLLQGAMLRNKNLKFICKDVYLKVENINTRFSSFYKDKGIVKIPIAHAEGNYYTDSQTLEQLISENRVIFRYCAENGEITEQANPNGSMDNIAGIINAQGNVLGMMPHPERCAQDIFTNKDGQLLFKSIVNSL